MKTFVIVDEKIGYIDGYVTDNTITYAIIVIPNVEILERQLKDLVLLDIQQTKHHHNIFFG